MILDTAGLINTGRIDCGVTLLYVLNYSVLVDNKRRTSGEPALFIKDAVGY